MDTKDLFLLSLRKHIDWKLIPTENIELAQIDPIALARIMTNSLAWYPELIKSPKKVAGFNVQTNPQTGLQEEFIISLNPIITLLKQPDGLVFLKELLSEKKVSIGTYSDFCIREKIALDSESRNVQELDGLIVKYCSYIRTGMLNEHDAKKWIMDIIKQVNPSAKPVFDEHIPKTVPVS